MTAIKAADVDRFIAKPDSSQSIVLVFGPDAGLVRERVDALVRISVDDPSDPFTFVRIDGDELAGNPIHVAGHCYGCTAGQGSSCGGALKEAAE